MSSGIEGPRPKKASASTLQTSLCPHPLIPPCSPRSRVGLTVGLQDPEDLVPRHALHLGDTVRITENDADLRWGETATGELEDLVAYFFGGRFGPRRLGATVRDGRGGHALAVGVHSSGGSHQRCLCREEGRGTNRPMLADLLVGRGV